MISLLHQPDYEMLGDIEIREADWTKLRARGRMQFIAVCLRCSPSARIAVLLLLSSVGGFHDLSHVEGWAWFLLVLGAWCLFTSALYAIRAWHRLERRFTP